MSQHFSAGRLVLPRPDCNCKAWLQFLDKEKSSRSKLAYHCDFFKYKKKTAYSPETPALSTVNNCSPILYTLDTYINILFIQCFISILISIFLIFLWHEMAHKIEHPSMTAGTFVYWVHVRWPYRGLGALVWPLLYPILNNIIYFSGLIRSTGP